MSSKQQYRDYNIRMKRQIGALKSSNSFQTKQNIWLHNKLNAIVADNQNTKQENRNLLQALRKTRRWWQILIIIKTKEL